MRYRLEYWTNLRECHGTNVGSYFIIDLSSDEYDVLMEKIEVINEADDVLESMRNELPAELAEKLITGIEDDYKELEWGHYQAEYEMENDDESDDDDESDYDDDESDYYDYYVPDDDDDDGPDYEEFEGFFADIEYTIVEVGVEKW